MRRTLWCLALAYLMAVSCVAQEQREDTTYYRIETRDGNEYTGTIIFQDGEKIRFNATALGELLLFRKDILKQEVVISGTKQLAWFENPQAWYYLSLPTGYGLKKGEAYFQNTWVLFNQFTIAPTDHFSVGLGVFPAFLFSASTPVWATAKFSIPLSPNKIQLGANVLYGTVLGTSENNNSFGLAFGTATFGSRNKNLSVGLGYGSSGGTWSTSPILTLGGIIRVTKNGYLITENYFIKSGERYVGILSVGGRRMINNISINYGLYIPVNIDTDNFIAIPWLGLTVPLNRKAE